MHGINRFRDTIYPYYKVFSLYNQLQIKGDFNMRKKNLSINDITMEAGDLEGALKGLNSFVFDKFSSVKVERQDLSALQGLVKAIEIMATKHADDIEKLELEN